MPGEVTDAPQLLSIKRIEDDPKPLHFPTTPLMKRSAVEGDAIKIPAGDMTPSPSGDVREVAFSSPNLSSTSFDESANRKGFRLKAKQRKRSSVASNGVTGSEFDVNGFRSQPDLSKMSSVKRVSKVELLNVPDTDVDASATNYFTSDPEGKVKIRMETSGPGSAKPMTIHSLFKRTVQRSPYHPALAYKKDPNKRDYTHINYIEYYQLCVKAAKSFIKLGLDEANSVGIIGFNSVEWFISNIGAIFAGGFACGIYTTNSPDVCQYVADNANAQIIVVDDISQTKKILGVREQLPKLKKIVQWKGDLPDDNSGLLMKWEQFIEIGSDLPNSVVEERLRKQVPNQCASLIYTSGTTGNPKGVMMSHDNITWTAQCIGNYGNLGMNRELLISYLPLSHVAAQLVDLFGAMTFGATTYFAQPDALKGSLGVTLREVRPTVFFGVPRVWEKFQEKMMSVGKSVSGTKKKLATWAKGVGHRGTMALMANRPHPWGWSLANLLVFSRIKKVLGLDRCKICVTAAAPITKETLDYFASLSIPIMEVYGMSESTGPHTMSIPSKFCITSVGQSPPGIHTKLHNPDADGNGEVCMSSRNVFMGYLRQMEKTLETVDEEGWLHSGDVGKMDDKGFYFITGRIKELLITAGGENVAPVPVEDKVKEKLPCLSNCMLIGDKKKFLSMMLTVKCEVDDEGSPLDQLAEAAVDWLKEKGIANVNSVTDFQREADNKDSPLSKAIQAGIQAANSEAVSRACVVQKWKVLPKDFSLIGGELGPTLKLRRPIVSKMYSSTINAFYAE